MQHNPSQPTTNQASVYRVTATGQSCGVKFTLELGIRKSLRTAQRLADKYNRDPGNLGYARVEVLNQ